jgi:hypothetical protein
MRSIYPYLVITYHEAMTEGLWHCEEYAVTAYIRSDKQDECRRDVVDFDYFPAIMATLEPTHYAKMSSTTALQ